MFKAHNDEICPEKYEEYVQLFEGDHNEVQKFFTRILIVLYYKKFRSCFGSKSPTDLCSPVSSYNRHHIALQEIVLYSEEEWKCH